MTNLIKQVGEKINISSLHNNPIVFAILSVVLTMYGPRLQPGLPKPIMEIFNNNYFRFAVMLLIAYLSSRNLQLAIILSLALCLLTSLSSSQEMYINFGDLLKKTLDKPTVDTPVSEVNTGSLESTLDKNPVEQPEQLKSLESNVNPETKEQDNLHQINPNPRSVCENDFEDTKCIDYCYSRAGLRDEFCRTNFPDPQANCLNANNDDERLKCLKNNCNLSNNSGKTFCKFSQTLNKMDKIRHNIVSNINQYKNPLE
jgi:hypothetical protein